MKKFQKGFTLIELLISVSLLAIVAVVSVNIITTLLRSSVKAQMAVDIEQASSFVFLKMENDIKKSYDAQVVGTTLTLRQGSPTSPVTVSYRLGSNCNGPLLNCVFTNQGSGEVKITDDTTTTVGGAPTLSAVSIDLANSSFSIVYDTSTPPRPVAVTIIIKFVKPNTSGAKMFDAETTLDTSVVLRGSY